MKKKGRFYCVVIFSDRVIVIIVYKQFGMYNIAKNIYVMFAISISETFAFI